MSDRRFDVICLGRAAVDLYGEQPGATLEGTLSFAKYIGGSAANIAVGCARLGLRTALLSRVGDEAMGRFVLRTLADAGVDVTQVQRDPARLTGLVLLALRGREDFPHLFYRENCADMALGVADVDPAFIASARALVLTGTHLSAPGPRAACHAALDYARAAATRAVLDIDFRPVLWRLATHDQGASRRAQGEAATAALQALLPGLDLVVGTEEEFQIAGGSPDLATALREVRARTDALLVVKRGTRGSRAYAGAIPGDLDATAGAPAPRVEVLNALGAGDAFIGGFLAAWLGGEDAARCCAWGNACGALVVARHGCAPAMPSRPELETFLARGDDGPLRPDADAAFRRLHRVTTRAATPPELCVLAFDHRRQFDALAAAEHADAAAITRFKGLIGEALRRVCADGELAGRAGLLIDELYGREVLDAFTGSGVWIARPVEVSGSRPLRFDAGERLGLALREWPADHVAKCLVIAHPDDAPALREEQERQVRALHAACEAGGRELLLEPVLPGTGARDDAAVLRLIERFYALGVYPDWWKIVPPAAATWPRLDALLRRHDPHCRGVLLLGQGAGFDTLAAGFRAAAGQPLCRGFAVGRLIFGEPADAWFAGRLGDEAAIAAVAERYRHVLALWRGRGDKA
ncbi:5-dehydro-2-deoxygluconokinase [Plasticicumulans lactativorans]|uniref:5-dehydro-2-deoxygluconokinase n=1 Tax=Plasticicumulans lactativorans TaxID=1133106 RepID=A0A4R2LA45_9GAMM|nr:5-dehydro-2-deoxygluconokinase [Plasticicumulans lactativorans]TCO79648.1 5-dehydro-2-deoxygluconokinase [Plasticicumulans lactativorans]